MLAVIIIAIVGGLVFCGMCMMISAAPDEEERKHEDEEQMEYLKRWRETHDKH